MLSYHIRTHTGEKPYACEHGGKSFTTQEDLTKHIRTHTGEKPYACGHCGKSFSRRDSLSEYIRIHIVDKPYACEHCGKSFTKQGNLTRHKDLWMIILFDNLYFNKSIWKYFSLNFFYQTITLTHSHTLEICVLVKFA